MFGGILVRQTPNRPFIGTFGRRIRLIWCRHKDGLSVAKVGTMARLNFPGIWSSISAKIRSFVFDTRLAVFYATLHNATFNCVDFVVKLCDCT